MRRPWNQKKNHLPFASWIEKINKKPTLEARRTHWRLEIVRVKPPGWREMLLLSEESVGVKGGRALISHSHIWKCTWKFSCNHSHPLLPVSLWNHRDLQAEYPCLRTEDGEGSALNGIQGWRTEAESKHKKHGNTEHKVPMKSKLHRAKIAWHSSLIK